MRRMWGNISKGKKIAGLVVLCLMVVLGYFGYHRIVAHADQYVTNGVIEDIEKLPKNPDAEVGTAQHPFLILEVVPYSGLAEFGYMIDGCEPIDFSNAKGNIYNNNYSVGSVLTQAFIDEYEREHESFVSSSWKKNKNSSWSVTGYYEKVGPGKGNFVYDGTTYADDSHVLSKNTVYRPRPESFNKVKQGEGDFIWVSLGSDISTNVLQEALYSTDASKPVTFSPGDREYTTRTDTGYYYYDSSSGYYPGLRERFIDEFERDKDTYDDNAYAWKKEPEEERELLGYYEYVGAGKGNFVSDKNREDGSFPINLPVLPGTVYRPDFSKVGDGQGDFIWVTTGLNPGNSELQNGHYSANVLGYYERVEDGTGEYEYVGNNDTENPFTGQTLTGDKKYLPTFQKAEDGKGDFNWKTEVYWYYPEGQYSVATKGDKINFHVGDRCPGRLEADKHAKFTFSVGDREYMSRKDTGVYIREVKDPDQNRDRYYVHHNQFLRTALHLRTREEIENYHIVIKTIEPWELNAAPEWIDYADLIYMHQGGHSVGIGATYWNDPSYWRTDKENESLKRVTDTNGLDGKTIKGAYVKNPITERKIGDNFSSRDDFSWEVAKKLFLKVNALEDYDENGKFRFAPLMIQGTLLNAMDSLFAETKKAVTHYPMDYTTMETKKTTDIRGRSESLASTENSANQANFYKFLIMNFMMNQENFYRYFYKTPRSTTGNCVIQESGSLGLHSAQDEGDSQNYWSVRAFLPAPDTNTLQWSDELLKYYEIVHDSGAFMNYNGNVALNGASFMYNSDSSVSQMFNSGAIKENDRLGDAFDWQDEEHGWKQDSLSPVQMLEYLLNYKKKGSSDEDEKQRDKMLIRILEIEPCSDYIWNNASVVNAFFPPSRFRTEVTCMTTQEFNGVKTDLPNEYEMVYVGMTTGKFNSRTETDENTKLEFGVGEYVDYNDAGWASSFYLAGKVYLHVGDLIQAASDKALRFSGNDISSLKRKELQSYVRPNSSGDSASGVLILDDVLKNFKTRKYTRKVDSASYLTTLLDNVSEKTNVESYDTLKNQYTKLITMLKNSKAIYKSQMEIVDTPPEYVKGKNSGTEAASGSSIKEVAGDTEHSYQVLNSSTLHFTFNINELSRADLTKKLGMAVTENEIKEMNDKKFGIRLYMDIDYDGLITDNDEKSELVYDSDKDWQEYGMPRNYKSGSTYTFSFDFAKVYEQRNLAKRKNGAVTWRFEIYDISDGSYYVSKTGNSWYQGSAEKMKIRFYQIVADNSALGSKMNLEEQSHESDSLFYKYTKNLADYEIASDSETVTLDDYIKKYNNEVATIQDEQEKLAVFQDYDMVILSCADKMQTEAVNSPDAIEFIKKLADSGISVLYTTQSVSREHVADAASVSTQMKGMLNQSRFDSNGQYYDIPGYSSGKKSATGQLAETGVYRQSQYELEYTYKAVMQAGSDSNDKMCFNNDKWEASGVQFGAGDDDVRTDTITQVNEGKLSSYPYKIDLEREITLDESKMTLAGMNISGVAAQDYQLNMNHPNLTVWYCLGGEENSLYGISPNDATNNYYLYTVGNVAYTGADLANIESDMEMKLFVNTLVANYEVGSLYPRVVVNSVVGISSADKDAEVRASEQFTNTDRTLYYDAIMAEMKKQYLDYAPNSTPIPVAGPTATPPVVVLDTPEPQESEPAASVSPGDSGVSGTGQATSQPSSTSEAGEDPTPDQPMPTIFHTPKPSHDPNKVKEVAASDDNSYIPSGEDYTHKVYFTPFDNDVPGGDIQSLRISLIDKATSGKSSEDQVYDQIKHIFHRDVTGKIFRYTASADGTFTVSKGNFTQDSKEYFFLYKEKYMLTNFNYVKFEIENAKKSGITYLYPHNQVKGDNTYIFQLD